MFLRQGGDAAYAIPEEKGATLTARQGKMGGNKPV
jgi:hypothetical protein